MEDRSQYLEDIIFTLIEDNSCVKIICKDSQEVLFPKAILKLNGVKHIDHAKDYSLFSCNMLLNYLLYKRWYTGDEIAFEFQ